MSTGVFSRTRRKEPRRAGLLALLAALAVLPAPALGQEDPVAWTLEAVPEQVRAGSWSQLTVRAVLDPGWHIYGVTQPRPPIATSIRVGPESVARSRPPRQPEPIRRFDEAFGIETEFFEEAVAFRVPFTVVSEPGERALEVQVKYQPCTDRVCMPPTEQVLPVQLTVLAAVEGGTGVELSSAGPGGANDPVVAPPLISVRGDEAGDDDASEAPAAVTDPASAAETAENAPAPASRALSDASTATAFSPVTAAQAGERGLGGFLLLAALMGALALLTPCVFPMVPITVSYFAKQGSRAPSSGVDHTHVRDALLYGGGIVLAFSGLGLLLAAVYGATGINRFAANPWINLLVAGLFIGFAMDLLGVFELRLPWEWISRVNASSQREGMLGLVFMGVAFAVTTFTCTVPFVGTLLVSAAGGDWLRPLVGMLAFSAVLAVPFVVLALFPALLGALPKSGSWMGALMVVLGLIELGAALKFLSNVDLVWQLGLLHRPVVLAMWVALALLAALYLLGQIQLPRGAEGGARPVIGVGRMLAGGAFVALALFLVPGLFGRSVGEFEAFLPPAVYPGEEPIASLGGLGRGGDGDTELLLWNASYARAQEKAEATGQPIFIDFTGYTCTNCRWMEANVFSRPDIRQRFERYVLIRLYTDGRGEEYQRNQEMQKERFGTLALPLYVILSPEGEMIATFPGLTRDPHEFAAFLDKGLEAREQAAAAAQPSSTALAPPRRPIPEATRKAES